MYLVNRCRYFSCIDAGKTKIPSYFLPLVINCFISSKLKGSDLFVIVPQLFSGSNADTATNVTELLKHISFRKQWFTHRPDIDLGMVVASCFGYTYIWIYSGGAGSVRIGDYPYPSTWRDRRRLSIARRGSMIWFGTVDQLGVPHLPPPTGKDRSFCERGRWRAARPLAVGGCVDTGGPAAAAADAPPGFTTGPMSPRTRRSRRERGAAANSPVALRPCRSQCQWAVRGLAAGSVAHSARVFYSSPLAAVVGCDQAGTPAVHTRARAAGVRQLWCGAYMMIWWVLVAARCQIPVLSSRGVPYPLEALKGGQLFSAISEAKA